MEIVNLRRLSGKVKLGGVVVCLAGAAVLAFYKGPHLKPLNHHHPFGGGNSREAEGADVHQRRTWIKGCFLMLTSNTLWGLWLVLQVRVLKNYPSKLFFTTVQCLLSTIQSFLVAIAFERNSSRWKLRLDIGLLAVAYCGVAVTGISYYLQTWVIEKKGPVFLAMFSPLSLVATMVCSTFLLGEVITLGSVVGGVFLVSGLYSVLWGKSKEEIDSKLASEEEKEISEERNEIIISPI